MVAVVAIDLILAVVANHHTVVVLRQLRIIMVAVVVIDLPLEADHHIVVVLRQLRIIMVVVDLILEVDHHTVVVMVVMVEITIDVEVMRESLKTDMSVERDVLITQSRRVVVTCNRLQTSLKNMRRLHDELEWVSIHPR
jgi:hypothetical protein